MMLIAYRDDIGFEKWTRIHSEGDRYNMMTSNNAEAINSAIRHAKGFPIVALFKYIRVTLSKWFNKHRIEASLNKQELSPVTMDVIHVRTELSSTYNVKTLNPDEYEVMNENGSVLVDLETQKCSCKVWDFDKIPCEHAIAVIYRKKLNVVDFVSPYYSQENWELTYKDTIYPELREDDWDVPEDVANERCHPPVVKKRKGRAQKKRIPSVGEWKNKKQIVMNLSSA